jgi:3,4-dihydroxyphenylacetate 2,3-dioxygenase
MGKLALAAKITHALAVPERAAGPRHGTRQDAIDGHREIGRRCRELGVDTLVVFDTHWLVNANYHINCAPRFKGVYTSNELPHFISNMPLVPGQPRTGPAAGADLQRTGRGDAGARRHHAAARVRHPGADALHERDQHFKVVSVSALCTSHYLNDSARLGWAMREAVEEHYDGTVAFLASGSLSHRFAQNGLAPEFAFKVWSPFLERLDHEVIALWQRGDWAVLRHAARVRDQGPWRRLHARHRHAAGRAGLVGLRRPGRGRHALLRRLGHGPDQRRVPGHAAGRPRHSAAQASPPAATRPSRL